MRYHLTLDESAADYDKMIEVQGVQFVFDPFTAALIEEITVDYDDFDDNFTVRSKNGPESSC